MLRHFLMLLLVAVQGWAAISAHSQDRPRIEILPESEFWFRRGFVEFRARKDTAVGHAFIVFGWEYRDGGVYYYDAAGFYPPQSGESILSQLNQAWSSDGPGRVIFEPEADWQVSEQLRVYVTEDQARRAKWIAQNWNSKEYKLPTMNCTHLVNDVASSLGLETRGVSTMQHPEWVVRSLRRKNDSYTALREGATQDAGAMERQYVSALKDAQYRARYGPYRDQFPSDRDPGYRIGGGRGEPPARPDFPSGGNYATGKYFPVWTTSPGFTPYYVPGTRTPVFAEPSAPDAWLEQFIPK